MTLVIAGYQFGSAQSPEPTGIFIAADSAITDSSGATLLNGFRKIYSVEARLLRPYFNGEYFHSYRSVHQTAEVALAFAGSTLTAQHYLNTITTHLEQLHITCGDSFPLRYRVGLFCEKNPLVERRGQPWDEETFVPQRDYEGLLTHTVIAEAVLHSLQHAMKSAAEYKLTREAFNSLLTPFVMGVQCPKERTYHLYEYAMSSCMVNQKMTPSVVKHEIAHDSVSVLGMRREWASSAQTVFLSARKAGQARIEEVMFNLLDTAITTVQQRGDVGIARPAYLAVLQDQKLRMVASKPAK
jgi:hypothetical protein